MDNLARLAEDFFVFEAEHKLMDKTIDGVYYWSLVRSRIFDAILSYKGELGPIAYTVPQGKLSKISAFMKYSMNAAANAIRGYAKADVLVVNHPRKVKVEGEYQDIYSQWLVDELKAKGENYLVLDYPQNWSKHFIKKDKHTRNLENFSILKKVYYKFFAKNTISTDKDIEEISRGLKERFGTDGDFRNTCFTQINIFKADYQYYLKLLKKIQPKSIYYVVINAQRGLIAAAKALNIPITEIQHGVIWRYGLNYSFPGEKSVPYFPDKMCLFGEYWKDITPIPLEDGDYTYYRNTIRQHQPIKHSGDKNKKVVIISQPTVARELIAFVARLLEDKRSEEYEFIIKLHPSEFHVWSKVYPQLEQLVKSPKVRLIDSFDVPLYDVLREADSAIGVASTALFEALYFGCDVYLLDVTGADYSRALMNDKIATILQGEEEFWSQISESKCDKLDIDYIFAK